VPGLSAVDRKKIEAQLWKAHGAFWNNPDGPSAHADPMRNAFDGIAKVLCDAGILSVDLLRKQIPELVWDSAIAGGWWFRASDVRQDIFPEQIGHHWVWRDDTSDEAALFRSETGKWLGKLLEDSAHAKKHAGPRSDNVRKRRRDPGIEELNRRIRQLRDEGLTHKEVCDRLGEDPRPPRAVWRDLPWPTAYKLHGSAVSKWLSDACRLISAR